MPCNSTGACVSDANAAKVFSLGEDASKSVVVQKADFEDPQLSPISLMPKDLLKQLNQNETLDLFAYILSRGNPQHAAFKP